ncbi:MAG: excinuclease ABC subunit UvrC [bacterium]|nr:excinuclease ABC subunit UvrC [bacterium]
MVEKTEKNRPNIEYFRQWVQSAPDLPGVYLMRDARGHVIYVGKANSLKSRLKDYFYLRDTRQSIPYLLEKLSSVDTIVTADEREALLLEAQLIKENSPRYNVKLKDDRSYIMVKIDIGASWPRVETVREKKTDGAIYLGPYAYGHELRSLLDTVHKTVPLRTCSDSVMRNRVRPCLEYQMNRCCGPCCGLVTEEEYSEHLESALAILRGDAAEVELIFRGKMEEASKELRYEEAALYRDRLRALQRVGQDTRRYSGMSEEDVDAVGIYYDGEKATATILSIRNGKLAGGKSFSALGESLSREEVLRGFLLQYIVAGNDFAGTVILPYPPEDIEDIVAMAFRNSEQKIRLVYPRQGEKLRLLRLALINARQNHFLESGKDKAVVKAGEDLKRLLAMSSVPRTIDCIDISHISGTATVGAVVSFRDGLPNKRRYRTYQFASDGKVDDFACIHETVFRHLRRLADDAGEPDLLVIDGGPGQLSEALKARHEAGLTYPPIISLAKKRSRDTGRKVQSMYTGISVKPERIYMEGIAEPLELGAGSAALTLLESLRDESHRFAIFSHRKLRRKNMFSSVLDQIPGIGKERRKAMLKSFGSVEAIRQATPELLRDKAGIPLRLGELIVKTLNSPTESDVTQTPTNNRNKKLIRET